MQHFCQCNFFHKSDAEVNCFSAKNHILTIRLSSKLTVGEYMHVYRNTSTDQYVVNQV